MKNIKLFIYITLISILTLTSCNNFNVWGGIGAEPDRTAPVLTIISPANNSFLNQTFDITGTATDNVGVTSVSLKFYKNVVVDNVITKKEELSGNAILKGKNWRYYVNGTLSSGKYTVEISANDEAFNSSSTSNVSILINVDATPSSSTINSPTLLTKEELEQKDNHDFSQIDYFQNKNFQIVGQVDDDFKVKNVTVELRDHDNSADIAYSITFDQTTVSENSDQTTDYEHSAITGSLLSWAITVDSVNKVKIGGKPLDAHTRYYLDVWTTVSDQADNITTDNKGTLCIYQDSDLPWTRLINLSDESNKIGRQGAINGTSYDDDGLAEIYTVITDEFENAPTDMSKWTTTKVNSKVYSWSVKAPDKYGTFRIYYFAKDIYDTTCDITSDVFVIEDLNVPDISINNFVTFPTTLANTEFTLKGKIVDNSTVITSSYMAWVPSDMINSDLTFLNEKWLDVTTDGIWRDDIKYWKIDLNDPEIKEQSHAYLIEKILDMTSDFTLQDGSIEYKDKRLYFYAINDAGKFSTYSMSIPGDTTVPEVAITEPTSDSTTPIKNVADSGFTISGTASDYQSGIKSSYIRYKNTNGELKDVDLTINNGNWTVTSDKFTNLGGGTQSFDVFIIDNYGNVAQTRRTLVVDNDSPFITSVTSSLPSGTYTLSQANVPIQVKFNKKVTVTGTPKLKLNAADDLYATFTSMADDGTTMNMTYTLAQGHTASPLDLTGDELVLDGATIKDTASNDSSVELPKPGSATSLNPKQIYIDTQAPYIQAFTTNVSGTFKADTEIIITAKFNEIVTTSATPTLTLNATNGSQNAVAKYSGGSATDTLTFVYKIAAGENTPTDKTLDVTTATLTGVVDVAGNDADSTVPKEAKDGSLAKNNVIVDTNAPTLQSIACTQDGVKNGENYYLKAGKKLTLTLTFNENVYIGGTSPTLTFNTTTKTATATCIGGSGTTSLSFAYTVESGENASPLNVKSHTLSNVSDLAGNAITSSVDISDKKIYIDTTAPNKLTFSNITSDQVISTSPYTINLGSYETNATVEYSLDNGVSWTNNNTSTSFSTDGKTGSFTVKARQTDIAGNISEEVQCPITIDTIEPKITSISSTTPNGSYKAGSQINVTISFSKAISGSGNLSLSLSSNASVNIPSFTKQTSISLIYTVGANQNADKLTATSISGTFTDASGNTMSTTLPTEDNFKNNSITIDTTIPAVATYGVTKIGDAEQTSNIDKGTTTQNVKTSSDITFVMSEEVSKGSGSIILERKYKSYPAVLTNSQYATYLAADSTIKDYYINRCIGTNDNLGTEPDVDAKWVLKYEIEHGAYNTKPSKTAGSVWEAFDKLGYNKVEIKVNSSLVSLDSDNKSVTVKLASDLPQGIEFNVTGTAGAFVDKAGNSTATKTWFAIETGPVADPIIRINKKSGLEVSGQPKTTGVKISTETQGATITYGTTSASSTSSGNRITSSSVSEPSVTTTYNSASPLSIGDDNTTYGYIYKIHAQATKNGLSNSDTTKELAYRTVIYDGNCKFGFRGSDSTGGVATTTEFPLSWYEDLITAKASSSGYLYSWHIIRDFQCKAMNPSGKFSEGDNVNGYMGCYNVVNFQWQP